MLYQEEVKKICQLICPIFPKFNSESQSYSTDFLCRILVIPKII